MKFSARSAAPVMLCLLARSPPSTNAFLSCSTKTTTTTGLISPFRGCRLYRSTWSHRGENDENRLNYSNEEVTDSGEQDSDLKSPPTDYVFGYGSLMCSHSRALTAPSLAKIHVTPVVITNVEPVFAKRSKIGMTAMGIRHQRGASTFGVVVPVPPLDLPKFDDREKGYSRISLPLESVSPVAFLDYTTTARDEGLFLNTRDRNPLQHPKIWAYLPDVYTPVCESFPIVQSYVDTILRGCLDVGGKEFAKEFLQTTKGWNPLDLTDYSDETDGGIRSSLIGSFWIDDREDPIYTRGDPTHSQANANVFDDLLETHVPTFSRRRALST